MALTDDEAAARDEALALNGKIRGEALDVLLLTWKIARDLEALGRHDLADAAGDAAAALDSALTTTARLEQGLRSAH